MLSHRADLILYNADVITLDPKLPRAEAVAIKGERILGVGTKEDIEALLGQKTKLLNCEGKTLIPGFNDAHIHILAYAQSLITPDLSKATSIPQIKEIIRSQAQKTKPGTWITGMGYDEFRLEEKRHPNRWDLDEVAPHHPVRLIHRSGYACVLNSLALSLIGITIETPEPLGGIIERELITGEPNGILFGMNEYIRERLPLMTEEELDQALSLANASFLSYGITSLQDASVSNDLRQWHLFKKIKEEGKLLSRLNIMVGYHAFEDFLKEGFIPRYGDNKLRLGGVKFVLRKTNGIYPPEEEIKEIALRAHKAGFQLLFHAIEEDELSFALSVLEFIGAKEGHRHRLEHCSICPPNLISRLKGTGAIVATQPSFLYYSGDRYLATVPPEQIPWLYRIGTFHREGIKVAGGSDAPVSNPNPLIGIYSAITRKSEMGQVLLPYEAISPIQALKIYTINSAFSSFEEREKGSIEVGKLADLVLLSQNPTRISPEGIKEIKVEMTMIGGTLREL